MTKLPDNNFTTAIRAICRENLSLAPSESLAVVADPPQVELAGRITASAAELCREAILLKVGVIEHAGAVPDGFTFEALTRADCALLVTSKSLSHTDVRRRACRQAGRRIASMPGITEEMISRLFAAGDAQKLRRRTARLAARLEGAGEIRLCTGLGTDLELSVAGRKLYLDTGIYHKWGSFGNLPAGEVSWAPVEGTARGRVVVDVAFAGVGAVERLELTIENGSLISASGSRAKRVLALIAGPAARLLAEFGIGTNSMAQPGANTLEAEKAVGTVHFGFGDNRSFGGSNAAAGHWDAVLRCRQIELDGQPLALDETVFFDSCGNSSTP